MSATPLTDRISAEQARRSRIPPGAVTSDHERAVIERGLRHVPHARWVELALHARLPGRVTPP